MHQAPEGSQLSTALLVTIPRSKSGVPKQQRPESGAAQLSVINSTSRHGNRL